MFNISKRAAAVISQNYQKNSEYSLFYKIKK